MARNVQRIREALKRVAPKGRKLTASEIAALYGSENPAGRPDLKLSPLERRIQRRDVSPPGRG